MEFSNDTEFLLQILENGAKRAGAIAETTIKDVRNKIGLDCRSGDTVKECKQSSN